MSLIVKADNLSRTAKRNIWKNLVFVFAYNVLDLPIAAGVSVPDLQTARTRQRPPAESDRVLVRRKTNVRSRITGQAASLHSRLGPDRARSQLGMGDAPDA